MDQEVLDRINKRLDELEKVYCRYQGPPGKPGKDAPPPRIMIGTVTSGDQPDAKIRTADGTFILDLSLPRGSDGRDGYSDVPGPRGRDGADAVTTISLGQVVSGREAMASLRHEGDVVILDLVLPRGSQGERGETGPCGRGERGETGAPGRDGKDSTVPGPRGEQGPQGDRGPAGSKGDCPSTEELTNLIRQVIDQSPDKFRGPMGYPGRDGKDGVGLRGPVGKPGDISAAVVQAEREARSVVREELAEILARLERLERAK